MKVSILAICNITVKVFIIFLIIAADLSQDNMKNFDSLEEFGAYYTENLDWISLSVEVHIDNAKVIYSKDQEIVVYFNYKNEKGWIKSLDTAIHVLMQKKINLREELSIEYGGLQYLRDNYLSNEVVVKNKFENFSSHLIFFANFLQSDQRILADEFTFSNEAFLNLLSEKLNEAEVDDVINAEIPILYLIVKYLNEKYGNEVKIRDSNNFLREEFPSVIIKIDSENELNLSDLLFRSLFPDFDRDDFENEEDVIIDLNSVKKYLDYLNSKRKIKVNEQ